MLQQTVYKLVTENTKKMSLIAKTTATYKCKNNVATKFININIASIKVLNF